MTHLWPIERVHVPDVHMMPLASVHTALAGLASDAFYVHVGCTIMLILPALKLSSHTCFALWQTLPSA